MNEDGGKKSRKEGKVIKQEAKRKGKIQERREMKRKYKSQKMQD